MINIVCGYSYDKVDLFNNTLQSDLIVSLESSLALFGQLDIGTSRDLHTNFLFQFQIMLLCGCKAKRLYWVGLKIRAFSPMRIF